MSAPRRILLVDDEDALREALADVLRLRGHLVSEAATAAQAEELARDETFDVLVSDVRLERDNGLTLAGRLRDARPELAVVFITGYGSNELEAAARAMGARAFFRKPFRAAELAASIEQLPVARPPAGAESVLRPEPEDGDLYREEREVRALLWEARGSEGGEDR